MFSTMWVSNLADFSKCSLSLSLPTIVFEYKRFLILNIRNEWSEFKIEHDSTTFFSVDKQTGTTTIKKASIQDDLKFNGELVVKQSELVALQQQLATALGRIQTLETTVTTLESKVTTLQSKPTTSIVSVKNNVRNAPVTVTCSVGVVVNCVNRSTQVRSSSFFVAIVAFSETVFYIVIRSAIQIGYTTTRWQKLSMLRQQLSQHP
jgi:hypothetical protein